MQPNPHFVERWSTRDVTALIASTIVALATLVFLGDFMIRGATPPVIGLLTMTLGAKSLTLVTHSRAGQQRRTFRRRRLGRIRDWLHTPRT
jgi:hypothetical protein